MKGFLLGVAVTLIALAVFGYFGIVTGRMIPANADAKPSRLERWAASRSLHATLAREAPKTPNPVPLTGDNLVAGIKLYAQNCAVCHGAADGAPSTIAVGLYQHAPQLAKHGVEDDPEGVTYWKVYHGIRLTGMPSFGHALTDEQIWQLAMFLKHMNELPPAAQRVWKAVKNPAPEPSMNLGME